MIRPPSVPLPALSGWALVLGSSSGFGAAVASVLARAGCHIIGVHLDRRATRGEAERVQNEIKAFGREAWFFNVNAADDLKRGSVLDEVKKRFSARAKNESVRILLHSLAFGSLKPLAGGSRGDDLTQAQIEMTCNVMGHSLAYWVQDLLRRELLGKEGRIFAMTSTGSWSVWPHYGAVSAAKAALESHVRQLAIELAPLGITANALCAGVTDTPALRKIPEHASMIEVALRKNPHHRLTVAEDVACAVAALAQPCMYWVNGNVINVDGGEAIRG